MEEEARLTAKIAEKTKLINCPPGYGPEEASNDEDRLYALYCKRISPPTCGGGVLTHAEDAEEAQLTARVAAYEETPEGRGRLRIYNLTLKRFSRGELSSAEQNELDGLRALYPDLPLDPDDKEWHDAISEAFKKWGGEST